MSESSAPRRSLLATVAGLPRPRVAVLRALRMGDFLLAVPALRALRAALPHAEVTFIGLPLAEPLAARYPRYIDRFWAFPGFPGIAEPRWSSSERLPGLTRFLERARAHGFDLAIQMHGSGVFSNPFILMLGARYAAGYRRRGDDHFGLDFSLPFPEGAHEIDVNLNLMLALGAPDLGRDLEFPVGPEDRVAALDLLPDRWGRDERPLVGLHPGAKTQARRWPAERFAAVGDALAAEFGAHVFLTGGPAEAPVCAEVARRMRYPACTLAGHTSLGALAGLLRMASCFISNDTGPAHLAAAIGTPSITFFGPAIPDVWAPADARRHPVLHHPVPCSPCAFDECPVPGHPCMEGITVETAVERARLLLTEAASGR